jgi:hypothetical protein
MKLMHYLSLIMLAAVGLIISSCFVGGQYTANNYDRGNDGSRGNNGYVYEGAFEQNDDVFIFTDRSGDEFDLYLEPINRISKRFNGYPLKPGRAYNIRISETKMYPKPDERKQDNTLTFKWGTKVLTDDKYYVMYTSPDLFNYQGQLYEKQ